MVKYNRRQKNDKGLKKIDQETVNLPRFKYIILIILRILLILGGIFLSISFMYFSFIEFAIQYIIFLGFISIIAAFFLIILEISQHIDKNPNLKQKNKSPDEIMQEKAIKKFSLTKKIEENIGRVPSR